MKKPSVKTISVNGKDVRLTNLDRVLWPEEGYTKSHLIKYYIQISSYLLPYLKNRPFVMSRYPNGIGEENFYQKNCPDYAPEWIETFPVKNESENKTTNYILCNNIETLIWLANQCCIEINPWLSTVHAPAIPDIAVFDLDPVPPVGYHDAVEIAVLIKKALDEFNISSYPKTSGSTGMHIFTPLQPGYSYEDVRTFVLYIFKLINRIAPYKTTLERLVKNRTGVYLDYLQNSMGKTMAWQYSLRPRTSAPASTPLTWEEVKGHHDPRLFTMETIPERLKSKGDLFEGMLSDRQNIDHILKISRKG